ncbi:MAG TPA: hypothetical protein VED59_00340, partial [Acidimicrobiales bacterium]|nr:hypothetical protein [Acidimicrobiales bacterium]
DALASAALLASLMCSTTGDAMLIGGAVLLFARRPARRAAAVLALPVASYAVWFAFIGRLGLSSRADQFRLSTFTGLPAYVWTGLSSALGKAFNLEEAGAAILVVLIAWLIWQSGTLWHLHPCLLGLSAAAVMFYVLAAVGRDELGDPSAVSRYVYVTIAILVPVVAKILSPSASWPAWRGTCLAATVLLAATALGNVGQAQSYLSMRLALVGNLKADTFAAARLLASGVRDVAGPGAQPIMYEPNLSAAVLARLERSHLLPSQRLSPVQLVNARTVLSVALSPRPLSSGRFAFLGNAYSVQSRRTVHGGQCMVFSPQAVSQPMQVWLQIRRGEGSASARISTVPASSSLTNYLAAVIVPAGGPATTRPAELAVPPGGSAYVNYNDPGAKLALLWTQGTPLTVCGLLHGAGGGG